MATYYRLKATLSENVNKTFRIETRVFHILHRFNELKRFPIIINNFNRLEYLRQQVEWLRGAGYNNLHIIDNGSTFPPLLHYYKTVKATVYFLDRNVGHEAFWRTHLFQRFGRYYHVLTDPDVLPDEVTPPDFLRHFYEILLRYPLIKKVGFGLRIDNIPDHYPKKKEVIEWESQYHQTPFEEGLYRARIDTTFALYRPGAMFQCWNETLRTGAPYLLRHMSWYENPGDPTDETTYYINAISGVSTWYKSLSGEDSRYALDRLHGLGKRLNAVDERKGRKKG